MHDLALHLHLLLNLVSLTGDDLRTVRILMNKQPGDVPRINTQATGACQQHIDAHIQGGMLWVAVDIREILRVVIIAEQRTRAEKSSLWHRKVKQGGAEAHHY